MASAGDVPEGRRNQSYAEMQAAGIQAILPEFVLDRSVVEQAIEAAEGKDAAAAAAAVDATAADTEGGDAASVASGSTGRGSSTTGRGGRGGRRSRRQQKRAGDQDADIGMGAKTRELMLCGALLGGRCRAPGGDASRCHRIHDLDQFFARRPDPIAEECPAFAAFGQCPAGLNCRFASCLDVAARKSLRKPDASADPPETCTNKPHPLLGLLLRKNRYTVDVSDTPPMSDLRGEAGRAAYLASRPSARERWAKVEAFRSRLPGAAIIAPLTTVGNLPFRRLCTDMAADVTVGEMAIASEVLKGASGETALLARHPSERTFGVQLAGGNEGVLSRACEVLERECGAFDFVDLNMGCPLDMVCNKSMGAQTMCAGKRFEPMIRAMAKSTSRPVTLKMRTGLGPQSLMAEGLAVRARKTWDIAAVTIHGRTRAARYSKTADWDYIKAVVDEVSLPLVGAPLGGAAAPKFGGAAGSALAAAAAEAMASGMPNAGIATAEAAAEGQARLAAAGSSALSGDGEDFAADIPALPIIGNGDVLDPSDFHSHIAATGVVTCMLGRGILYKPWLCEEIKAGVAIDKSARERLDMYRDFCRYGLEYWGTDQLGVDRTRRFLLELLSFTHRYVPFGLLALPPQRMNLRPQAYRGRDDLETLLSSGESADWVRISEMFLGPVRDGFRFVPKHKAKSFGSGSSAVASAAGLAVAADQSLLGLGVDTASLTSGKVVTEWG
ncbi:hypothetical protein FNF31_00476 [Cafeteria roenbergensis]|uniref:tRNA-dihydrouridine(47) synthase [NAD(P)(+)] n=3 Tax=Cafeteria roenbergensis TaxID=33653 RepID=A0A5A8DT30_CAFRO|nr:hypothetical protein FNF31_00476 [Cafeteria roenbergensis]